MVDFFLACISLFKTKPPNLLFVKVFCIFTFYFFSTCNCVPPAAEVLVVVLFPDLEDDDRNLDPDEDDRDEEDRDPPRLFAPVKVKNNTQRTNKIDNDLFCTNILVNCHDVVCGSAMAKEGRM